MVATLNILETNEAPELTKARQEVTVKLSTIRINDQSKAAARVFVTLFDAYKIPPYQQQYLFNSMEYLFVALGRERFKDFMTTYLPSILAFQRDEDYEVFDRAKKRESAELAIVKRQKHSPEP